MRTLKKSLALVLALVMVLGLGVIGASADNALDNYTDASEIGDAYYEAVGVLTGLGIIDGMTETTIEPTGTYTREQAAKIIATMVLGVKNAESLTCVEAPFDDVPADRWSAGYIAFCVEQGIIDGMTDTTFEPTGTLTGFQWAKMLLAAVASARTVSSPVPPGPSTPPASPMRPASSQATSPALTTLTSPVSRPPSTPLIPSPKLSRFLTPPTTITISTAWLGTSGLTSSVPGGLTALAIPSARASLT